jgi:hypothetical protein
MPVSLAPEISSVHTILSPDGAFGYLGSNFKDTEIESQANRFLIAAAPSLLDALKSLLSQVRGYQECNGDKGIDTLQATVAIFMATGETL